MLREIGGGVRQGRDSGPLLALDAQSTQTGDQEQTLACFLESLEPDYSQILEVLCEHYALEIHRLVQALLDSLEGPGGEASQPVEVDGIVRQVFVGAVSDFDQLRDAEGIRVWLSKSAVNAVLAYRRRRRRQILTRPASGAIPEQETHRPQAEVEQQYWAAIEGLTETERLCVVLRYVHNVTVPDIAHVLEIGDEKVHIHLAAARRAIQQEVTDFGGQPESGQVEEHLEIRRQVQASLDGLLDDVPGARMRLEQHLSSCVECRAYAREVHRITSRLAKVLQARWPVPVLDPADIQRFVAVAQAKLRKTRAANRFLIQFKTIGLFGAVFLAALVALWGIKRVDTHEGMLLFPPTPILPPTSIEASAGVIGGVSEQEEEPGDYIPENIYNTEPSVSVDGNSIAFVSTADMLVAGDENGVADVFVTNRQTGVIECVSVSSDGVQGNGKSFNARISADGRLVVFASLADNLIAGDNQTCVLWDDSEGSCADIFVHDRNASITERITLAYDGSEANGHSLLPTISANRRWVVFWSDASNLVEGDSEKCGEGDSAQNCWDVFVYDRETRLIDRIPVGGNRQQMPISISDDGRYLAIFVQSSDSVAEKAGVTNYVDVFVYDRQTDTFESVNVSSEGAPGNRASTSAVISSDGRYVAFVSWAYNLVPGDTNGHADVFVRDRVAHTTERVSVSSDGVEGNSASGTLHLYGAEGEGEQIGLSADGRYVVFTSYADNLVPGEENVSSPWVACNGVYMRDRQTGRTELVVHGQPGGGCFYPYLSISGNGRWISLIEILPNAAPTEIGFELVLHDQQTGLTENLLRDKSLADRDISISPHLFLQHYSAVNTVAFSPDGQIVATGASDGAVRLWRVSDGTLLHTLEGHTRPVSGLAFFRDGTLLISSARDNAVGIWQVSDGALLSWLKEDGRGILSLALSPDDSMVALGSSETVRVWEVDTEVFTLVDSQEYPGNYVSSLAFSPDGAVLAIALSNDTVWLRRIPGGKPLLRLGGHTGKMLSLAFSSDGRYLATGGDDNILNLWQLDEKPKGKLEAQHVLTLQHQDWVKSLAFFPDGTMLASGTLDGEVRLWSIPDGALLKTLHTPWYGVMSVAFSRDGRTLASVTAGGDLRLWRVAESSPR
jgi:RNA polymerase sigma factor (sigma-70 family)